MSDLATSLFPDQLLSMEQLVTALCHILSGMTGDAAPFALQSSSVLGKLLAGQKIDTIGVVRAFQLYSALSVEEQKQFKNKSLLPTKGLAFLDRLDARSLLERYFLAATMKDCSIMLSVRLVKPSEAGTNYPLPIFRIPGAEHIQLAYSIRVVDLDPKTPKNLISAYHRFMDGVKLCREMGRRPCRI